MRFSQALDRGCIHALCEQMGPGRVSIRTVALSWSCYPLMEGKRYDMDKKKTQLKFWSEFLLLYCPNTITRLRPTWSNALHKAATDDAARRDKTWQRSSASASTKSLDSHWFSAAQPAQCCRWTRMSPGKVWWKHFSHLDVTGRGSCDPVRVTPNPNRDWNETELLNLIKISN